MRRVSVTAMASVTANHSHRIGADMPIHLAIADVDLLPGSPKWTFVELEPAVGLEPTTC